MTNRINVTYWVITGLMAAFMLMASIPDVLRQPQAIEVFGHLGYPAYLLPFLGTAKILGVIAVLVPGAGRLKEWATRAWSSTSSARFTRTCRWVIR